MPAELLDTGERNDAIKYIAQNPQIWEVILTGGDPLVLSARHMGDIMGALSSIEHIKVIRFHTRVPIADPGRVSDELISAISGGQTDESVERKKTIYMALHVNHRDEITPEVERVIGKLHYAGVNLLSQSVLLRGVNDDVRVLESLFRHLVALNVQPYYLHHPDLAPGTAHFRMPIAQGKEIVKGLHGKLSGLCQPRYMLDIPGGYGKVPITDDYVEVRDDGRYDVTDYRGQKHLYSDACE